MSIAAKGVTFALSFDTVDQGVHTGEFDMVLSRVTIGAPEVKTYYVDVPGMDGAVDLTSYLGDTVRYKNRTLQFEFTFLVKDAGLLSAYTQLLGCLHGIYRGYIKIDGDDRFYYSGRVFVGDLKKGAVSKVTVKCDCEPYKTNIATHEKVL